MDICDDIGLIALICRHAIPLFFANIDTPDNATLIFITGSQATVFALYDFLLSF